MHLNWIGYDFCPYDGYGRYSVNLIRALAHMGAMITPVADGQMAMPGWMRRMAGVDFSRLSVACIPPFMLRSLPGRQWSLSMTEGSRLPANWANTLNWTVERVIVPCEHNKEAYHRSGVTQPIDVIHGGTDPVEFRELPFTWRDDGTPYTFLALGDRGARKGWIEVWAAFFKAFGTAKDTPNVRLIVKARPNMNTTFDIVANATNQDRRISFWREDVVSMADIYAQAHCFAIPSRSEGWGMPHREAAMMGLPVITIKHGGLDDGHTEKWSLVVEKMHEHQINENIHEHIAGSWMRADVEELASLMRWCYDNPEKAAEKGKQSARWLRENQTWDHSAMALLNLINRYG